MQQTLSEKAFLSAFLQLKTLWIVPIGIAYQGMLANYGTSQVPSLWGNGGDMSTSTFGQGGHQIFYPPQHFVIKSDVIVQTSWLHYSWKCFPAA